MPQYIVCYEIDTLDKDEQGIVSHQDEGLQNECYTVIYNFRDSAGYNAVSTSTFVGPYNGTSAELRNAILLQLHQKLDHAFSRLKITLFVAQLGLDVATHPDPLF